MEEEWGPAFVHESGHALVAVLCDVPCHGICLERDGGKLQFCALIPPITQKSTKHYLVLAAGVAAENLIYPSLPSLGEGADREAFDSPDAPLFEATVQQAYKILSDKKRKLKRLVSMLKTSARKVGYDLTLLSEAGMDGTAKKYLVLLGKDQLETAVRRP